MFSSLKVRNYRIYWLGMFVSLIGTWIQSMAQSWLVFRLTNSAFLLGLVGFLNSIPIFLLALLGGVLADRVNKKHILIFTQTAFMVLAFLLAALTQLEIVSPSQIMLISLLNGIVMAFDAPARQSVVVELAGTQNLPNAIALNSVAFNSSRMIGPALAGILIGVVGMSGCFYINGISFFAVIIALLLVRINNNPRKERHLPVIEDLKEGFAFVRDNKMVLALVVTTAIASLFGISHVILMPIFANDILKKGAGGLATLMSYAGFGALLGALLLARLGDFRYKGRFLVFSAFVFSLSILLFSLSRIYMLSLVLLACAGASYITTIALINTLLQINVPHEFRGRVMSLFMLTFAGLTPFGNLIAGALAQLRGAPFAVLVNAIICLLSFALVNIFYPKIRDI